MIRQLELRRLELTFEDWLTTRNGGRIPGGCPYDFLKDFHNWFAWQKYVHYDKLTPAEALTRVFLDNMAKLRQLSRRYIDDVSRRIEQDIIYMHPPQLKDKDTP